MYVLEKFDKSLNEIVQRETNVKLKIR